jgi:hypothetical protein
MPMTVQPYSRVARNTTARNAAFNPAQSPPLVRMPMRFAAMAAVCPLMPRLSNRAKVARMAEPIDQEGIRKKLADLRSEHRDLDDVIAKVTETAPFDQIQVQRLKKRKLMLKDQIAILESKLVPDIIA